MSSFGLSYAPSETLGFIPERLERLTTIMARQVLEKKAPGVSMLIARHGKVAYRDFVGALRPGGPANAIPRSARSARLPRISICPPMCCVSGSPSSRN